MGAYIAIQNTGWFFYIMIQNSKVRILVVLAGIFFCHSSHIWADVVPDAVNRAIADLVPGLAPDLVAETPYSNLYLVVFGTEVFYLSVDGRYLLVGDLIELESGSNLAEDVRRTIRKKIINELDESGMVIFSPEKVQSKITVFTDVSCGYCVKFHQEIRELMNEGIEVRYLGYPRAGIPSSAHEVLVSVWCATNPQQAMTDAKAGVRIENKKCNAPISDHMQVAEQIGVRGTPTVFSEAGVQLGGYLPPDDLLLMLQELESD